MKNKTALIKSMIMVIAILLIAVPVIGLTYKAAFGYGGGGGGGGITYPSSASVSINSGAASTNAREVTLALSASNATLMAISNTSSFSGVSYETYTTSKAWTLSDGAGEKTVYVKFRSSTGGEAEANDIITYTISADETPADDEVPPAEDTTPPPADTTPAEDTTPPPADETGYDEALARRLAGWILLQVESRGEAYYVYPGDLMRYYLGRPADAFRIMSDLGLGITNANLEKIEAGTL
jgi:hypothetical protein